MPKVTNKYWQAKQSAAWAVVDAKNLEWEEFGETMEQDFSHCQSIGQLSGGSGWGEQQLVHIVLQ